MTHQSCPVLSCPVLSYSWALDAFKSLKAYCHTSLAGCLTVTLLLSTMAVAFAVWQTCMLYEHASGRGLLLPEQTSFSVVLSSATGVSSLAALWSILGTLHSFSYLPQPAMQLWSYTRLLFDRGQSMPAKSGSP